MNLALNARDAMPNGGRLVVSTSATEVDERYVQMNREASMGSFACLTVTDTGCGMDAATMKRIFEPFFTTKEVGKGTGLGLSTVYGIVKQHRGWVEVSSIPGKGTTFRVLLPVSGVPRVAAEPATPPPLRGGRETILVVEDEGRVRSLVRKILEGQGYHVLEAASGPEALSISRDTSQRIDLLLTDMVMPSGMSGKQVAAKLLAERRALKVVYSSGYSLETAGKDPSALKDGAYLQKPYRPETLVRLVRDCLDGNLVPPPSDDEVTAADLRYRVDLPR
jgi:CheY-like chemotaxis protein